MAAGNNIAAQLHQDRHQITARTRRPPRPPDDIYGEGQEDDRPAHSSLPNTEHTFIFPLPQIDSTLAVVSVPRTATHTPGTTCPAPHALVVGLSGPAGEPACRGGGTDHGAGRGGAGSYNWGCWCVSR